jgi:TldD protein
MTGVSPLAAMNGATISTPTLDVVDDPTRFDLPGAFSCDDEGIQAEPLPLVEGGRLTGWICDREGAERLGSRPGRGRRSSWTEPPLPRISNLIVMPGTTSAQDMERDIAHGLVVTRIGGATVDPISTRALIRVERGWEIRNGRRRRPLAGLELTGPVLEVLSNIDPAMGDDPTPDWRLGWCMKGSMPLPTGSSAPTIMTHRLEVL